MTLIQSIVSRYGGSLAHDKQSGAIPAPGHSPKDRSVSLRLNMDGKLLIHCFSDTDWRDVKVLLTQDGAASTDDFVSSASGWHRTGGAHARTQRAQAVSPSLGHAKMAWSKRTIVERSIAASYLSLRGLPSLITSPALGFVDALPLSPHKAAPAEPCLLAKISNQAGEFVGVQATFLFRRSCRLQKRRLVFGRQKGFAIHIGSASNTLLVGEGLESTASAARRLNAPAWALLNTANLSSFQAPEGVKSLIIACDNDGPGRKAAERCRDRHNARGLCCEIKAPDTVGADWNDLDRRPGAP
ncbi:MAG: toprim domain-containing protein [Henriciella sp.]|nr:toprim domain-containing protein [Henriciella sp.]